MLVTWTSLFLCPRIIDKLVENAQAKDVRLQCGLLSIPVIENEDDSDSVIPAVLPTPRQEAQT